MEGNANSQRIYEGEEVFNAGHIILCGRFQHTEAQGCIAIYALCLQTSALHSSPHIIRRQVQVGNLEQLSQTDLKCAWSLRKDTSTEQYKPVPWEFVVRDLSSTNPANNNSMHEAELDILLNQVSESVIMMELNGLTVAVNDCVPHNNNWLGYSPDGVIFENNKPTALLEIKCPFA
ncbi:hypothetical protein ILUMI_20325, partial [Ignelater luminosus]